MVKKETEFNKNILIAVDESENARRAVSYVGEMLAGVQGFKVIILHVISQPEEDFFSTAAEKDKWLGQYKLKVDAMLENYRKGLIADGFEPQDVSARSTLRYCPSLAECILAERGQTNCSTIVVGRQGISRSLSRKWRKHKTILLAEGG